MLLAFGLLAGCGDEPVEVTTQPVTTEVPVETTVEVTTEPPPVLTLNTEELTLTEVGQQEMIYSGDIPVELIRWSTDNSSVAVVDKGVVTAMGTGVANIYGVFDDQSVTCAVNSSATYTGDRNPILSMPETYSVDASFFDDAVFVGDSISMTLFRCQNGMLGNAQFLVQGSYSIHNAVYDSGPMYYRGRPYNNLEDAVAATEPKKIFVLLGVNDLGLFGVDKTLEDYKVMILQIHEACPDADIYIQSMTPIWTGNERRLLTNNNVRAFDAMLRSFALENGFGYIDLAPYLQDYTGGLATCYTSDNYVHLSEEGVKLWASVLRAYPDYDTTE